MIGLVVVSHSRALAEAAVGLAKEMVDQSALPRIAIAAGLDATTLGTDAVAVSEAIGEVDGPDGVLVLLDLGSAVLSTEMALEFVDADTAARVTVSSAPLVEGLVAAVVLASTGAPIAAVAEEALNGLAAKQDHLGGAAADVNAPMALSDAAEAAASDGPPADVRSAEISVTNAHGLHARPAARLVSLVRSFDAAVRLTNVRTGRGPVDAASLSRVATLNAREGDTLRVDTSGPDADRAMTAVRDLAGRAFDDETEPASAVSPVIGGPSRAGSGLDIAIGPALVPVVEIDISGYAAEDVDTELRRSRDGVTAAAESLTRLREDSMALIGAAEAAIFDAQLAMLSDPSLEESAEQAIGEGEPATGAWAASLTALAAEFESLDDDYQRARAQDVRSVQRRLLAVLIGRDDLDSAARGDTGILVVPELDAATAATLDPALIVGVATMAGGATGHGVIVAKSRGLPIITDVGDAAADVQDGDLVAFDARSGTFVVRPGASEQARFEAEIARRTDRLAGALTLAGEPAVTTDGCKIHVAANVSSVDDALVAAEQGAEGSGLVRTEILFGADATRPSVERQAEEFLAVAKALRGQPITIRTWDVGGDKPLRFLPQPVEANPFLGERGLRLFRRQPDILREQLAAICLTARETPTKVMFPMVTTVAEVDWALDQLHAAADATTGGVPSTLEVGVMIEVPAAALRAGRLAAKLDFVSIGTNDLTQYTTAAERGNAAVSALADSLEPAVLQLIGSVCDAVPDRVVVAVCGDLASNDAVAPLLIGLGVRELSSVAPAVPSVKAAVRGTSLTAARGLAARALAATGAADVRLLLG